MGWINKLLQIGEKELKQSFNNIISNITPKNNNSLKINNNISNKKEWVKEGNAFSKTTTGEPLVYYHGTNEVFNKFDNTKSFDGWHFLSESADFANDYAKDYKNTPNILPVHIKVKNTFSPYDNKSIKEYSDFLKKKEGWNDAKIEQHIYDIQDTAVGWTELESTPFKAFLKQSKYDSFVVPENGILNIAVKNPESIKGKFSKTFTDSEKDFMKAALPIGGAAEAKRNSKFKIQQEDLPLEDNLLGF